MEPEQKERFITITSPGRSVLQCTACNKHLPKFMQQEALANGCQHCRYHSILYDDVSSSNSTDATTTTSDSPSNAWSNTLSPNKGQTMQGPTSIHRLFRGDDGPKSKWRVQGVWEAGEEPLKKKGAVRFVVMSDTHELEAKFDVPPGDVLLHAGDFSMTGSLEPIKKFNEWLGKLPHTNKIVIAGNHDLTFDVEYYRNKWFKYHDVPFSPNAVKNTLTNCIYLEDSEVVLFNNLRIWGSPWQPEFCDWAFNLKTTKELKEKWDLIPNGIDILMTHGPPFGIGDECADGRRVGCKALMDTIYRVRPSIHICGHIHEGRGYCQSDGVVFMNASSVNLDYSPIFRAYVFDMEVVKQDACLIG